MADLDRVPDGDAMIIDDDLWEELIILTDGAVALCFQCGVCTAACPWGLVKQKPLSVRTLMRQAQLGLQGENGSLWLCTTCAQCEAYCPRGVDIANVFRGLRTIAWKQRKVEQGLPSLLWSVFWNNNPWSQPPNQRAQWARKLDIPVFNPEHHEILFYVGCTSSYDGRGQKVASALVQLFNAAGVQFGFLGEDEPCCGEAVLSVGHKDFFEEVTAQTGKVFQERGVTQLVTISPHCFDVFKNHYPTVADDFQPFHHTQYLAQLVDENRLQFERPLNSLVTFQDPCYLGRLNGEFDSPRQVLNAIPGVEISEMENWGADGLCCGGGGGRMWLETPHGERFSDLRIDQAIHSGANTVVTACPFCITCLEDSLKFLKRKNLEVCDVAEIAAQAIFP